MGCDSTKPKRSSVSKTYFNITHSQTNNKINNYQNYKTPVKLEFTIEGCENRHKYQILVEMSDNNERSSTEVAYAQQRILTFNTCYICDYFFERQQYLFIQLLKDGNIEGSIKPTLGIIVGSLNSTYRTVIGSKNENIIITAQGIKDIESYIDFDFLVKSLNNIDFSDIKNKISFKISNQGRLVYQSEPISFYGKFEKKRIPVALIEPNFTVTFLNNKQDVLAFKDETINSFTEEKNPNYLGISLNKNNMSIINNSKLFRHFSFLDYITNGVRIKLTIGIDFTSSNKSPKDPTSLHYLGGGMNDYELAIRACGEIVAFYDYNQSFPAYGFGAVIKGHQIPDMCFNINFQKDPEIYTIDNVIKEYHNCFQKIILAGPTEFCPLIQRVNENIKKENNPLKYHILMILTDGIIVDQQKTIDALVEGSFLPLSVIIIGIGNDHFQEMIQLDGDVIPLISSNGVKRMRDLVQFVPFNRYKNDPNELAAQVLEEVPRQIEEYYTMNNIYPDMLAKYQLNQTNRFKMGINSTMNNSSNNYISNTGRSNNFSNIVNNIYENSNNSYKNYLNQEHQNHYGNNSYRNFMNSSYKNNLISTNSSQYIQNSLNNYKIVFDEEIKSSIRTGKESSIYY